MHCVLEFKHEQQLLNFRTKLQPCINGKFIDASWNDSMWMSNCLAAAKLPWITLSSVIDGANEHDDCVPTLFGPDFSSNFFATIWNSLSETN